MSAALRGLVLPGAAAAAGAQEALRRLAGWWDRPPRERGEAAALLPELDHAGVAAWHMWLAQAHAGDSLLAWFGPDALAAIAAAPEPLAALEEALDRDIAALDAALSRQLDAVLHHPRLTRLEGSWRGLHWLAGRQDAQRAVKIRLLPLRWGELARDLERAAEFDRSQIFRLVYEEEFGTPGGEPFGMMAADFEVRDGPAPGHPVDDVVVLGLLASVAAAAFCPMVLAASPALMGLERFHGMAPGLDLAQALSGPAQRRWRNLAQREDTRFLALLMPRVPGRAAWEADGTRADGFRYRERAGDPAARVWTTPVYALAAAAARAFARYRWPAEIRGAEPGADASGGTIEGLPHQTFHADPPGPPARPPLETTLTDEQERQAASARIVALCGLDGLPEATFGAVPTLHAPPRMTSEAANANQALSSQLNSILCASRLAHVLKLMGRDMVGSALAPEEVELRLQQWLNRHVSGLAGGGDAAWRYPLRDAQVSVRERPDRPGTYGCTMLLQPHYQLDEVGTAFRLVTEITGPRQAA